MTKPSTHIKISDASSHTWQDPALVLVWSRDEPGRVGEALLFGDESRSEAKILGRSTPDSNAGSARLGFFQQRPGETKPTGQLFSERLSREHLSIRREGPGLFVQNVGKRAMLVNDDVVTSALIVPGQCVEIKNTIVLYCTWRPWVLAASSSLPGSLHAFGEPDAFGMVGESPTMWVLRDKLAFVASRKGHVLLKGEGGTGKELAATAIHSQSPRRGKGLVTLHVGACPSERVNVELFGNAKDFPVPGAAEKTGLIGAADGSTLFLDEVGELSQTVQSHLLRVLDRGEYSRLGEKHIQKSDFRLVAATNRGDDELKRDFVARFGMRVELAGLNDRREDTPLLARHLMRMVGERDKAIAARFFEGGSVSGYPRFGPNLIKALVQYRYKTHARQVLSMLWSAMLSSSGDTIEIEATASTEPPGAFVTTVPSTPVALMAEIDPEHLGAEQIQACLDKYGTLEEVWRALGLRNRSQLIRLIKKHGLSVKGGAAE